MASKDELYTPQQVHTHFKDNRAIYTRVQEGTGTIYANEDHTNKLKACAAECLDVINRFEKKYEELYQTLDSTRTKKINPKFVDRALVEFFEDYFQIELPTSGKHGVLDLNRTAHRAFSVYIRENDLNNKQFFKLDDRLQKLFDSPSLEDPNKSYLELTQDRVDQLGSDKKKITSSCSNIIRYEGGVSMNVAALKILVPKFGIDWTPGDSEKYIPAIADFVDILAERFDKAKARQAEEAKLNKVTN